VRETATNLSLFPEKGNFSIIRLSADDVRFRTDKLTAFTSLVLESEPMYPGIASWLRGKVLPQLGMGGDRAAERIAFVGFEGDEPVVSAVLKRGRSAKFCHLRIRDDFQDRHLGEIFFALMALEARRCSEIRFTLPESLWASRSGFFEGFGFSTVDLAPTQYRHGHDELRCSAPSNVVLQRVFAKLPKLNAAFSVAGRGLYPRLLMSVHPSHAHQILSGLKTVEVRKRFSARWEGATVALYATRPDRSLLGEARIERVVTGPPSALWSEFGAGIGASREQYMDYVGNAQEVVAIVLTQPSPFVSPIPLAQLNHLMGPSCEVEPPQSYCVVDDESHWSHALALASLLHGRFAARPACRPG
jgi:predicted transcriptional regulator